MTSKIGAGLKYYGIFEQSFTFVYVSIIVIIGTIFIATQMSKYKSWKSVNGRVNDNSMIEFKVDGENYSIPAVYYNIKGEEVTVYYNPNNIKSTATTQNYLFWSENGGYVLSFMWCLCILTGLFTWWTFKSPTVAKVVGGANLVENLLYPTF